MSFSRACLDLQGTRASWFIYVDVNTPGKTLSEFLASQARSDTVGLPFGHLVWSLTNDSRGCGHRFKDRYVSCDGFIVPSSCRGTELTKTE